MYDTRGDPIFGKLYGPTITRDSRDIGARKYVRDTQFRYRRAAAHSPALVDSEQYDLEQFTYAELVMR